ncbi:MAG: hypothetical protein C0184_03715, partial [Chloroflexus aggregans]
MKQRLLSCVLLHTLFWIVSSSVITANSPPYRQWVPVIFSSPPIPQYVVNAPYFATINLSERFSELAMFWFGRVSRSQNYTDVRVGYNDNELFLYLAVFDRQLWYDPTPDATDLTAWDAATIVIDTGSGPQLSAASYRFVAQFRGSPEPDARYQASQQAIGGSWSNTDIHFITIPGWRGDRLNDSNDEDRGWAMTFRIPFTSLGLSGRPPDGARWRLGVIVH